MADSADLLTDPLARSDRKSFERQDLPECRCRDSDAGSRDLCGKTMADIDSRIQQNLVFRGSESDRNSACAALP